MAILSSQFNKALESIEPSADDKANAPEAHNAVRAALTSADVLKEWGLNPVLIGSYKRDVSIRRVTDVDVFCRMATSSSSNCPPECLPPHVVREASHSAVSELFSQQRRLRR